MEAVPLDQLDPKLVAEGLAESTRRAATSPTSELEKAEVAIHHKVYQAMSAALTKSAAAK